MGKIRIASVSVVVALLVITVQAFYPTPPPVLAVSQTWYMTDSASGSNFVMNRGLGNGSSDLAMSTTDSKIWVADEAANVTLDMNGSWSVTLGITTRQGGAKLTVEIGHFSGSTFTSWGTSGAKSVSVGTMSFNVTTTSHSIAAGDYLAIRVRCTAKSFTLDLTGTTNSPSNVSSPTAANYYPWVALVISFTVTDYVATGLNFGSLSPGTSDNPEAAQNGTGAVLLTVAAETNVNCSVEVKGDNFEITVESGSATGADSPTVLIDSNQTDLLSTVSAGDKVINKTDGSSGTVATVASNTQLTLSAALTGGNDNTFQSGDNYVIIYSSPASTIDIINAKWDTDALVGGATPMTGTYAQITTSTAGVQKTQNVWHWLSIPNGKEAGDYVGMFYYQALQQ